MPGTEASRQVNQPKVSLPKGSSPFIQSQPSGLCPSPLMGHPSWHFISFYWVVSQTFSNGKVRGEKPIYNLHNNILDYRFA